MKLFPAALFIEDGWLGGGWVVAVWVDSAWAGWALALRDLLARLAGGRSVVFI